MSLLVCFGDQMIANEIEKDGTPRLTPRIRNKLRDWTVINAGSQNETLTTSLFRFQDDVLRFNPDVVTISFGIDEEQFKEPIDILEIEKNLLIMVQKIQPGKTILVTPLPLIDNMNKDRKGHLDSYAKAVRRIAEKTSCHLIDLCSIVHNHRMKNRLLNNNRINQQYTYSLLSELVVEKVNHITNRRTAKK
jgi:hypothetical protein